jgi:carbonic anhydrase/acetyltransferase-like protein (isoleucine patch superfamily)
MLIRHRGFEPDIDPSAYIASTAVVAGKVSVGPRVRIMFGAVLDSEASSIRIGECSVICENAVLRASAAGDEEYPVVVEDHVFISPHATLLGCTIERCSYVATGAAVLQGAILRSGAAVAVGALVHAGTVIPSGFFVPPNAIAIGDPVKLFSPDQKEELADAIKSIGFAKTAFNVDAGWDDRVSRYRQATEVRSTEFKAHFDDKIVKEDE